MKRITAIALSGIGGIERHRPRGPKAAAEIVHANHEKPPGIDRLARPHHVVPPAEVLGVARRHASDMVRGVQRMAHQHCIAAVGIGLAIGLVDELIVADRCAA